jgi:hypothetical protein|tara:strand:+ start:1646 stop:1882 length:237 start_codon:yes stop_codon:yes gene_type:complete
MKKILERIQNIVDPNYWATKIGERSGLYEWAMKSPIRKWSLGLTGWKWWMWQVGVGMLFFCILETLLNKIGMTMLPWK